MDATQQRESPRHRWLLCAFGIVVAGLATMGQPRNGGLYAQQSKPDPPSAEAERRFEGTCATCHGNDGKGAERGPDIVSSRRAAGRSIEDLERIIRYWDPDRWDAPERHAC